MKREGRGKDKSDNAKDRCREESEDISRRTNGVKEVIFQVRTLQLPGAWVKGARLTALGELVVEEVRSGRKKAPHNFEQLGP